MYQPTDWFPVDYVNVVAIYGVSVVNGNHKGWLELVFVNSLDVMDSWHLDGFGFYVVGQVTLHSSYFWGVELAPTGVRTRELTRNDH